MGVACSLRARALTIQNCPIHKRRKTFSMRTNDSLRNNDDIPNHTIWTAVFGNKWDQTRLLLQRSDSMRFLMHDNRMLYWACTQNPPVDIIESMYEIAPHQVLYQDRQGDTPLTAAYRCASSEVILFIQKALEECKCEYEYEYEYEYESSQGSKDSEMR